MPDRSKPIIAVVDHRGGRVLLASTVHNGRCHLDVVDTIRNGWEQHEHGRPSPRSGKQGNTYASWGHEDEALIRRFAKEVAAWLEQVADRHGARQVHLFSPPRLLGELRRTCPPRLAARIEEHEGDLGSIRAGDLERHPAIAAVLK